MLLSRARKVWGYAEKIKRGSKFSVAPQMHVKRWGKRLDPDVCTARLMYQVLPVQWKRQRLDKYHEDLGIVGTWM
jgi:hypothetical protein